MRATRTDSTDTARTLLRFFACFVLSAAAAATQADSLEVHPATQAAAADDSRQSSPALSATDEPVEADSQGFWEAEAIVRSVCFECLSGPH